jgi:hypothetical protein
VSGSGGLGNVTLTASGGPPGATVLLNGASSASVAVGGTATMTVAVPLNAGLGTYAVPITGMLGTVPRYALATLMIGAASPAGILAPPPGSILSSTPVTFTWSMGSGVSQYQLNLGSAPGAADYYSGSFNSQSATVPVPVQNQQTTFYATLQSLISGAWQSQSYSYRTGSRPTGATPGAAAAGPGQPGSYAVYNNNSPMVAGPYQVYNALTGAPLDAGYFDPNSCTVSGSGVIAGISAIPSQSVPGDYSTYDVTFTANYSTAPGARDLTCTWAGIPVTVTQAVTVYDASPVIDALQPFPPNPDGSFYITLYGTNFGPGPGSISVCASGDSSCAGTPDIEVDMNSIFWSDEQINVRLVPTPSISGSYDLQVGSVGETRNGFLAQQGATSSQSNRARLQINPSITLAVSNKLWFFGNGITPPAQFSLGVTMAVLSTNAAQGGSFYWSISAGQDKVSFNASYQQPTSYTVTDYVAIYTSGYSTDINDVTITLSYTSISGSTVSVSTSFTVDPPYKLVSNGPTTTVKVVPSGCVSQALGDWGYLSYVPYRMVSFLGIPIANEFVNEYFVNQIISVPNNWPTYASLQGHYLSADGTFFDHICVSGPAASPQPLKSGQLIDSGTQLWYIGSPLNGSGVEVQSDLFQRFQDHGGHTNVVSPVR